MPGRSDQGQVIERVVMEQFSRNLRRWKEAEAAGRWFYHHTILEARRHPSPPPEPAQDLLAAPSPADMQYLAFVRALRMLPRQQMEAFILHAGEKWPLRAMAISMDCSTSATDVHLKQAQEMLAGVAGEHFNDLKARFYKAYQALSPDMANSRPAIRYYARKGRKGSLIKTIFIGLVVMALTGVAAWWLWHNAH
jgi:DNA-directed RNA polymerase specialized sigma24 family protein